MTFIEAEKVASGDQVCDRKERALFGLAKVEVPRKHPSGDAKQKSGHGSGAPGRGKRFGAGVQDTPMFRGGVENAH